MGIVYNRSMEDTSETDIILRVNLLNEFIEKDLQRPQGHLQEKIAHLFDELEQSPLSDKDHQTLSDLKSSYQKRKEEQKEYPLSQLRANILKAAFLKYRGLVFDLKTRFDYTSAEVAIQDGLDVSEYFREVIEEINNDLNECLVVEDVKLSRVRDNISQYYVGFSRQKMAEIYPEMAKTLKEFREVLDSFNVFVS